MLRSGSPPDAHSGLPKRFSACSLTAFNTLNGSCTEAAEFSKLLLRPAALQPEFLDKHGDSLISQPPVFRKAHELRTTACRQRHDNNPTMACHVNYRFWTADRYASRALTTDADSCWRCSTAPYEDYFCEGGVVIIFASSLFDVASPLARLKTVQGIVTGNSAVSAISENGKSKQVPWPHFRSACLIVPE